jgi:hypothetical protein
MPRSRFNNAVELPQPIDQRTNYVSVGGVLVTVERHVPTGVGWLVVHESQPGADLGQPDPDHGFHQREARVQLSGDGSQWPMGLHRLQQRQRLRRRGARRSRPAT